MGFICSQFGMEMWARYAHKALWHDYEPGWKLHKSHHEPRTGPFEVDRKLGPCSCCLLALFSYAVVAFTSVLITLSCSLFVG
jgi:hypothetical protein